MLYVPAQRVCGARGVHLCQDALYTLLLDNADISAR